MIKLRKIRNRFKLNKVSDINRLRLSVLKTCKHVSAQVIDRFGNVISEISSSSKQSPVHNSSKALKAKWVGAEIAKKFGENNEFFFDRGGYAYHGIVKILAESARESGMRF